MPMIPVFYLPRRLFDSEKTYTEEELLPASNYIVVLAEPGGGKTELMQSLGRQLNVSTVTANFFGQVGADTENCPIVIDAFDELAKIDKTGINKLLANARKANPTQVIISSRSSEWDTASSKLFTQFLGEVPLVVRLYEFDEQEQRAIFENYLEGGDFEVFRAEITRFDLETLLPNPQFLKLFADAYIASERHFSDKRSIFVKAIERLAKEVNTEIVQVQPVLSIESKVDISSEVFAKLLLSGAEGVSTSEAAENRIYPSLPSLFSSTPADGILATRLFKPGDSVDHHRPVHKIISEYCAANYLIRRIADPVDHLTLSKCLPIIAPSSTVRDELRGLLGWMAALGNKSIEETAIELDPYAVLANGDPSQLAHTSKILLVNQLKEVEDKDPYFRKGDFQRKFSVAGFFTDDVVEHIKPFLTTESDGHLCELVLELLAGTPAIELLENELRQLVLTPEISGRVRLLANNRLLDLVGYDPFPDFEILISEATHISLKVVATAIEILGSETFEQAYLADLFRACAKLYPCHQDHLNGTAESRYFVRRLIDVLNLEAIEGLLNTLTKDLTCSCGKKPYECDCRNGISKIVGTMLDRFFKLNKSPVEPLLIWQWIENLNFHGGKAADQSKAVQALQEGHSLRQGIIAHVFEKLTDRDQIFETKRDKFILHSHSGLCFQADDNKFIVDLAFNTGNVDLWASFMAQHRYYRNGDHVGPDSLRRRMREQASEKLSFMREWVRSNRSDAQFEREIRVRNFRHARRMKRNRRQENDDRTMSLKYLQANRKLVESGRHWSFLVAFAQIVLNEPDRIEAEFGDEALVRNALQNCLPFISPHVPNLLKLAELQCGSQGLHSENILYAACLEIMRVRGNLENIDIRMLQALRTNIHMGGSATSEQERDSLKAEVDRLIFPDHLSAENFLRQYVEPQLAQTKCVNAEVWLLQQDDVFRNSCAGLSIEWLMRFPRLAIGPLDSLFEIAAQHGNRNELKKIIGSRCEEFISCGPTPTGNENIEERRKFWLLRAFYFLSDSPATYKGWLGTDKKLVHLFCSRTWKMKYGGHPFWPQLTSIKVEVILEAFMGKWPKVNLPNQHGTGSPTNEKAYRFLTEVVWFIDADDPDDAIPVLNRLLDKPNFVDLHKNLRSIQAGQIRKKALIDFEPPTPQEIVDSLDCDTAVTVESLRQLVLQELQSFQKDIIGGEFNSGDRFYEKGDRLDEQQSTLIIAERLKLRLEPQGIAITMEHQLKSAKRSDFTATKMIRGTRRLLVTEVKGQWHKELYTAAAAQLYELYSIHPDAEQQGIYLVIWFGGDEKVANVKTHGIDSGQDLKRKIEETLPAELKGLIDVFVLDVS